jgi:glutamate N-acetyltransferase/amino-acid N-acetyltransferase
VTEQNSDSVFCVDGCRLSSVAAGVRYSDRADIALIELAEDSVVVGAFTQNAFCAAPVEICKSHLDSPATIRYLLINSGNANAGTGQAGFDASFRTCELVAENTNVNAKQVLPFSTGVIGELLPTAPFEINIPVLVESLSETAWMDAAQAIMTTDTRPKFVTRSLDVLDNKVNIAGIAKGAGMFHPNMATMLAYIVSDIAISTELAKAWHLELCEKTFNRATVDGDTSTNDSSILACTGRVGNSPIEDAQSDAAVLVKAQLLEVYKELAQAIVKDGEGATKFVTIEIAGGGSAEECKEVAFSVAHSPLVKTALFASDPNWGRILMAIGNAKISNFDIGLVEVFLDDVPLVKDGAVHPDYSEEKGQSVFDRAEFTIRIDLNRGEVEEEFWTTDLSHDYVRINAEYRT